MAQLRDRTQKKNEKTKTPNDVDIVRRHVLVMHDEIMLSVLTNEDVVCAQMVVPMRRVHAASAVP